MSAMTSLVENAKQRYLETSRPNVVVHTADQVGHDNLKLRCQKLTTFSHISVHPSPGVVQRIKFVDLSAQSFYQKVYSTPLFVMHVNFWILPIGILKLGFHTVEDISSMDLLEREKVCLFSFFPCPQLKNGFSLRFDYLCSR